MDSQFRGYARGQTHTDTQQTARYNILLPYRGQSTNNNVTRCPQSRDARSNVAGVYIFLRYTVWHEWIVPSCRPALHAVETVLSGRLRVVIFRGRRNASHVACSQRYMTAAAAGQMPPPPSLATIQFSPRAAQDRRDSSPTCICTKTHCCQYVCTVRTRYTMEECVRHNLVFAAIFFFFFFFFHVQRDFTVEDDALRTRTLHTRAILTSLHT